MGCFCYLCFVSVELSCLFIAALWSPVGKGLTSLFSCVRCFLVCYFHVVSLVTLDIDCIDSRSFTSSLL